MLTDSLGVIRETMQTHDGTYTVRFGGRDMIVTQDPAFIEHFLKSNHRAYRKSDVISRDLARYLGRGLLTSEGDLWRRQRRAIQPGFHAQKLTGVFEVLARSIDGSVADFPTGETVDACDATKRVTFVAVIESLFSSALPNEDLRLIETTVREVQAYLFRTYRLPWLKPWFSLRGTEKRLADKVQQSRAVAQALVSSRIAKGDRPDDLLQLLLDVRDHETGQPMDEKQLLDEIFIFVVAGHETSGNALAFALHALATHPEVAKRLREETEGLGIEECASNPYAKAVVQEVLRLFPPAWIADRVALEDDAFGDFHYPKGTAVAAFFFGLHRDPAHWENPEQFDPDRFLNGETPKQGFLPFGLGARSCIGAQFAMAEMAYFLASMVQKYSLRPRGLEPRLVPEITLRPDKISLDVHARVTP